MEKNVREKLSVLRNEIIFYGYLKIKKWDYFSWTDEVLYLLGEYISKVFKSYVLGY